MASTSESAEGFPSKRGAAGVGRGGPSGGGHSHSHGHGGVAMPDPHAAYPSPPLHPEPPSAEERRLPASFLANLKPLLARFPLVHISMTPDSLPREERISRLQELQRTASPQFAPSLAGLADFYSRRGSMLPSRDTHVIAVGDVVFHGTAPDLKYFLGVWLRTASEQIVRDRYPVVDIACNPGAEGSSGASPGN